MRLTIYIFRALCAMLVGFLLVSNPQTMTPVLIQAIGGLFAAMALLSLASHYINRYRYASARRRAEAEGVTFIDVRNFSPATPFVAIGSIAFAAILIFFPESFVTALMYVLGGLLVFVGLGQAVALISARNVAPLGWALLLFPALLIAAGVWVVVRPMEAAMLPFIVLGVAFILYGVTEFCFGLRYYRFRRIFERTMKESQLSDASVTDFVEAEEVKD